MDNEPIKHHYIPQFILRNFCFEDNKLHYYDVIKKECIDKQTPKAFKEDNLYRNDINVDNPVKIEKDLAKYETNISNIFNKFTKDDVISISSEERAKVLLFLGIMGFRSKVAKDKTFSDEEKNIKWKKNLEVLANCSSLEEVCQSSADSDIKVFMKRDIDGFFGKQICIWEKSYGISFCIGDCYPVVVTGETIGSITMPMFDFYPISPNRVLVLMPKGVENVNDSIRVIDKTLIKKSLYNDQSKIKVFKIYEKDVMYINELVIKHSNIGIAFYDEKTKLLINKVKK